MNVFNEIDPYAAEWLRNLGADRVLEKSIADVAPEELHDATRFHTFAGIGLWEYALRLAGWPADVPVWTGSCPCQPFSTAGKGKGEEDPRHLWPDWRNLIELCRPPILFGEQVASPAGREWLDSVSADLETLGYAVGSADLCAAGVGAPHIRQRLFFVAHTDVPRPQRRWERWDRSNQWALGARRVASRLADSDRERSQEQRLYLRERGPQSKMPENARGSAVGPLADTYDTERGPNDTRRHDARGQNPRREKGSSNATEFGAVGEPGDANRYRGGGHSGAISRAETESDCSRKKARRLAHESESSGAARGFWAEAEWIPCSDGKARPVEPGTFPLAHGDPGRVGKLRAYGNAIVPQVAATFIRASMDVLFTPK